MHPRHPQRRRQRLGSPRCSAARAPTLEGIDMLLDCIWWTCCPPPGKRAARVLSDADGDPVESPAPTKLRSGRLRLQDRRRPVCRQAVLRQGDLRQAVAPTYRLVNRAPASRRSWARLIYIIGKKQEETATSPPAISARSPSSRHSDRRHPVRRRRRWSL